MGRAESFTELKLTLYTTTRHVCLIKIYQSTRFQKDFEKKELRKCQMVWIGVSEKIENIIGRLATLKMI